MKSIRITCLLIAGLVPAAQAMSGDSLLVETEISPAQVYVQSQAVYTLRFYQETDVRELNIRGPSARLAEVREIGRNVYETQRGGRHYRVHELRYAVFPFGSGPLILAGARVTGRLPVARTADGLSKLMLDVPPRTLEVLPAPATTESRLWLPASSVKLSDKWDPIAADFRVGVAHKRTIRIEASGIDAGLLPDMGINVSGASVYADPPRIENHFTGNTNIALREQTFRIVPIRAGELEFQPIAIHWWNVAAGTSFVATLPARKLHVAGSSPAAFTTTIERNKAASLLPWVGIFAAIALFATIIYGWLRRARLTAAWCLMRASRSGNARATGDSLLAWAASIWPGTPPLTLGALAERLHDQAACRELLCIERCIYGPAPCSRDKNSLVNAVRHVQRAVRQLGKH